MFGSSWLDGQWKLSKSLNKELITLPSETSGIQLHTTAAF